MLGMEKGFEPTIFIIPVSERKKTQNLTRHFQSILPKDWEGGEVEYRLTEKDIERAKVYFEQELNVYLAITMEYVYLEEPVKLRILRQYTNLSGVVAEHDNVLELGEYLNCRVIEL